MKGEVSKVVTDVLQSPKAAATVSAATTATGLGEYFYSLPWGLVASCFGAVLSAVMILIQLAKFIMYFRKHLIEMRILKQYEKSHRGAKSG